MHRIRLGLLAPAVALAFGLTACGSSSGGGHASGGGSAGNNAPKNRTVALHRFCDQMDAAATAKALGVPAVKLTVDLRPGQKFTPFPGSKQKATAAAYECTLATPSSQFAAGKRSVYLSASLAGPPPAGTSFEKLADQQFQSASQGAQCSRRPVTGWGRTTDSWTCTVSQGYAQVLDSRRAEFGTTRFGCSVDIGGDKSAQLTAVSAAADQLCNDLLAKISS